MKCQLEFIFRLSFSKNPEIWSCQTVLAHTILVRQFVYNNFHHQTLYTKIVYCSMNLSNTIFE